MRELFVYYRVPAAEQASVEAAVVAFQAKLMRRQPGLIARLLVRPDTVDGEQTWMETYAIDPARRPGGIDLALQARIEAEAALLEPLLRGPRHTEEFLERG